MFCSNCGNELQNGWKVCPKCGVKIKKIEDEFQQEKNKDEKKKNYKKKWIVLGIILLLFLGFVSICLNTDSAQQEGVIDKLTNFTTAYKDENRYYFQYNDEWILMYTSENEIVNMKNNTVKQCFEDLFGYNCYSEKAGSNLGFAFDLSNNEALIFLSTDTDDGHLSLVAYNFDDDEFRTMVDGEWWSVTDEFIDFVEECGVISSMKENISEFKTLLKQEELTVSNLLKIDYEYLSKQSIVEKDFSSEEKTENQIETEIEDVILEVQQQEESVNQRSNQLVDYEKYKDRYVGGWNDVTSQRCWLTIDSDDGRYYNIDINWSSSAWENTHWVFWGTLDETTGYITYSGDCIEEIYNDDGTVLKNYVYTDGNGQFYIGKDGTLLWVDRKENVGADCVFEKSGEQQLESEKPWYIEYYEFQSSDGMTDVEVMCMNDVVLCVTFYVGHASEEWNFEVDSEETGPNGELIYYCMGDTLTYYPDDHHIYLNTTDGLLENEYYSVR